MYFVYVPYVWFVKSVGPTGSCKYFRWYSAACPRCLALALKIVLIVVSDTVRRGQYGSSVR